MRRIRQCEEQEKDIGRGEMYGWRLSVIFLRSVHPNKTGHAADEDDNKDDTVNCLHKGG